MAKNRATAHIDDGVIRSLYEAAAGLVPWQQCLHQIHLALEPAFAVQLLVTDRRNGNLLLAEASPQSPVEVVLEYLREWHRVSPHVAHLASLPVGTVMNSARAFPPRRYADHPFYRDFWAAYGVTAMLGAKAAEDADKVAVFGVSRVAGHPAFSAADEAALARCTTHLAAAFRIATSLLPVRTAGIVGLGLMQASSRPMMLLDNQLNLLATNAPADRLLADGSTLCAARGALLCTLPEDGTRLQQALAKMAQAPAPAGAAGPAGLRGRGAGSAPSRTALRLAGAAGRPLLCSLWHMRPERTQGAFGPQPVALLSVNTDAPADAVWLGAMFDLTPAEATVAAALMGGMDVKQIAHAHHRSVHTVRSQMRAVLQKAGARRQVELVQLLLRASNM